MNIINELYDILGDVLNKYPDIKAKAKQVKLERDINKLQNDLKFDDNNADLIII